MRAHQTTAEPADVVAAFDSQDDADEAVLRLRISGVPDDRIGYFSRTEGGGVAEAPDRTRWMGGATLGALAGAALGVGLAWLLYTRSALSGVPDLFGLMATCAVFAALFGGFAGGSIGSGILRRGVAAPAHTGGTEPFVLAVAAGPAREQARAVLHDCGGHEVQPHAS
jgi:hypothetical protein